MSPVMWRGSLMRQPTPIERVQAASFTARDVQSGIGSGFKLWRTAVTAERLEQTVARYIGAERARAAFDGIPGAARGRGSAAAARPISGSSALPSICWPVRSALPRRGSSSR